MKNISLLNTTCLTFLALLALSSCGQKGPLVLEELPVEKVQQPFENSTDVVPVKKEGDVEVATDTNE